MIEQTTIAVGDGQVSALRLRPADAACMAVLAHGAGAGMRHAFMNAIAERLAARRVATLRYQFPFMESPFGSTRARRGHSPRAESKGPQPYDSAAATRPPHVEPKGGDAGRRRPDPPRLLEAAVRAAVAAAAGDLPLVAGGKSMGGRMTSQAAAAAPLPGVRGLFFLGFPLHPAKQPATARGTHLAAVTAPMLFLQGTRDALADIELMRAQVAALGPRATLHVIDGADHSFHVPARSGRTDADVVDELAERLATWALALCRPQNQR